MEPDTRVERVPLDTLTPHPRNVREGDVGAISVSLGQFGQYRPIVVQRATKHILAGTHTWKAANALGWDAIDAVMLDVDDATALRIMLADNRTHDLGHDREDDLVALLAGLDVGQMQGTGWDGDDLDALVRDIALREHAIAKEGRTGPDDLPELVEEPYVKPGDLWLLGPHRVLCGDATNPESVKRLLAGAEPTLLATDPPYGVQYDASWRNKPYGTERKFPSKWGTIGLDGKAPAAKPYMQVDADSSWEKLAKKRPTAAPAAEPYMQKGRTKGHGNTSISGDTIADWSPAFALVPSLQIGYVWYASAHTLAVLQGLVDIGFELAQQIIWDKGLFSIGRQWYHWNHEPCFIVRRKGTKNLPMYGPHNQATIWRAPSPKRLGSGSDEEKQDHPTQKPVLLFETPIGNHLLPGEVVYDPFLGSGTALIAAHRLGRVAYGMDVDPRFVQMIVERWQAFTGEKAILEGAPKEA